MPVDKPSINWPHVASGWRFMDEDVKGRIRHPTGFLVGYSKLRVLQWQPGVFQTGRIILVTAPHGFPVGGLELKPVRSARSEVLAFVGRATKDPGPLQVRIERSDFG